MRLRAVFAVVGGALVGLGCSTAPGAAPKSGSTPPKAAQAPVEPSPTSAPTSEEGLAFDGGEEKERPAGGKAHEQALMRRIEREPSGGERGPVPRACPGAEGQAAPSPSGSAAAPPAPLGAKPAPATGKEAPPCYPPLDYVERLCHSTYPSVALVLFRHGSPWRRGYLRGETKAWTTAPGAQQDDRLAQDEEVLILQADASAGGGVQYDSGASFYALRWDGSCVKLTQEEMLETVPWGKKTPVLRWSFLDEGQQTVLRQDPKIEAAYLEQRKQCRAAKRGDPACDKLERRLSDLIVAYVRAGRELPDPAYRP